MDNSEIEWIVLKFGGTSVSSRRQWDSISSILRSGDYADRRLVIVHSALAGVSDGLADLLEAAAADRECDTEAIKSQHLALARDLDLEGEPLLAPYFDRLDELLAGVRLACEATAPVEAMTMALGELMATKISARWLGSIGHGVEWVDARACLVSQDLPGRAARAGYLGATCPYDYDPDLAERFASISGIILTQGFIARNSQGEDVLLGRGGSDTSAAYMAAKLGAKRLEIWTDVAGVFTADPRIVSGARLLNELRYDEMQEIASMGGSVLHPRAIPPAREHGLPIHVRSTLTPECAGTRIAADVAFGAPQVKAIMIRKRTVLISMESLGMWHQVGFLAEVFGVFRDSDLSIDLVSTSETNVTVTLDADVNSLDPGALDRLRQKLESRCRVRIMDRTAVVCLIGSKIRALLHEIGPALQVFEEHPIYLVSQSASDLNLSFVVDEDRAEQLANKLHATLMGQGSGAVMGQTAEQINGPATASGVLRRHWWVEKRDRLIEIAGSNEAAYVYDTSVVEQALHRLASLSNMDRGFYAVKANNHPQVLGSVQDAGFGFECVSPGEVALVLDLFPDIDRERLIFTPNFAPREEYATALDAGVPVTVDNLHALRHWPETFQGRDIFLRLDPGYRKGHHSHVRTGGKLAKFGIPLASLGEALALASGCGARVVGLHAHIGSGILEPETWLRIGRAILEVAGEVKTLRALNLGGGLGVAERPGDIPLDLEALDACLAEVKKIRPDIELWLEPGRYIVAEAGVLLARVTQIKSKGDMRYVGVTTGMNSLIRPALYGSYHEIVNLTRLEEPASELTTIVGPICESGDRLGVDRLLPPCQENDVILISTAGAYGAVMSSRYNLREPAVEVIL
ncbi:MAG: bifunctional aspartate kinase/diaminopimelate decarboxylase [Proteobacteria bacterium]|nr:bifunctional aspartate kinase/diaminopimelate decarboxylase [Pseudomonadota bacterium]